MIEKKENFNVQAKQFIQPELREVLEPSRVCILKDSNKRNVLNLMIDCLASVPQVKDRDELSKGIFYREGLMSTGIGLGIAVPHVRLSSVKDIVMCVGLCRPPVTDYESLDGLPVHLIFMIAAGKNQHAQHLKLLSSISSKLKDEQLRDALINAPDVSVFYDILTKNDG